MEHDRILVCSSSGLWYDSSLSEPQFRTRTARCSGLVREKRAGDGLLLKPCHIDIAKRDLSAHMRLKKYEIEELRPTWLLLVPIGNVPLNRMKLARCELGICEVAFYDVVTVGYMH